MAKYLYNVRVCEFETDLCKMEFEVLFGFEFTDPIFFTSKYIDPSLSPYVKNRLEIIYSGLSIEEIVAQIEEDELKAEEFMVKYIPLLKKDEYVKLGKDLSKQIGFVITGEPEFKEPKIKFGIMFFENIWYFGRLEENNPKWRAHNNKPYSYSSSLGNTIAKALVNIATDCDTSKTIIDPCCGVGTLILEGQFSGYNICGREIKWNIANQARENLKYFGYDENVTTGDIKDITKEYDVAIIDLPYGNFSPVTNEQKLEIIYHAKRIAKRVVLISAEDIRGELEEIFTKISKTCRIQKRINKRFVRQVWVCES